MKKALPVITLLMQGIQFKAPVDYRHHIMREKRVYLKLSRLKSVSAI